VEVGADKHMKVTGKDKNTEYTESQVQNAGTDTGVKGHSKVQV
jgi:hypothetical protein